MTHTMTAERVMLGALVLLSLAVFVLSGWNQGIVLMMLAALAGGLLWAGLVTYVPYRWLYHAYIGGAAIPVGAAFAVLVAFS